MARKVIRTFGTWEELGKFIRAGARGGPRDEVPFRDLNGEPMTPEQMLDLARQIERETGNQVIHRRGERRAT